MTVTAVGSNIADVEWLGYPPFGEFQGDFFTIPPSRTECLVFGQFKHECGAAAWPVLARNPTAVALGDGFDQR